MFDLETLIKTGGYLGLFAIIFSETGLFLGFFLPGDSLLFTAGFLASQGYLNIFYLSIILFIAAVTGDSTGYFLGQKFGRKLFNKEDSLFFHKEHLVRAKNFYEKHGKKTIILARFIPVVRTFAPVIAGIGDMHYPTFLLYNIIGAIIWAIGIPWAGYFLGSAVPGIDKFLMPIIIVIVLVSVYPALHEILKTRKQRKKIYKLLASLPQKLKGGSFLKRIF